MIVMAVVIASAGIYQNCYLPEFEIVSTIKTGCDDFTSVYVTVRINRWFYDSEKMERKVQSIYNELNGKTEQLKILFL